MKISLLQYNPVWEDKESNQQKITRFINDYNEKIDLLIMPEMTLTGFTMNSNEFGEKIPGDSFNYFSSIAKNRNIYVIAGIIHTVNYQHYNALLLLKKNGELLSEYRKIHPFAFAKEDKFYSAGGEPVIVSIDDWKLGLSICYDLRFPELYRLYGKEKVNLMINIANWPITRIEHWRTLLKARAIENQCYVVGVNRVGKDKKVIYNGFSSIFGPMGDELLSIENKEGIFSVEISLDEVKMVREKFPFLNDIKLI